MTTGGDSLLYTYRKSGVMHELLSLSLYEYSMCVLFIELLEFYSHHDFEVLSKYINFVECISREILITFEV